MDQSDDRPVFSERARTAEDRSEPRIDVEFALTLDSPHNFYAGYATNLSAGGFFVATHIVHPVGTRFRFTIHLGATEQRVEGTGEVRWLRSNASGDGPAGVGIQFLDIDGDGARFIDAFLRQRAPMAVPRD